MTLVHLKKGREKSLRHRHPWVYSGAIDKVSGDPKQGDIVAVVDGSGDFLARGYYNDKSKIVVRVLEWNETDSIDAAWWHERIRVAALARSTIISPDTNACRIVHAEADFLPGLVVDRYNEVLVVQFLTAGVERARAEIIDALKAVLHPSAIFEKSDTSSRNREGLAASTGWISGEANDEVDFVENKLVFSANPVAGQKTGFYLDQRDNRAAAARYASGRAVLDAFSYTGAFAVSMGRAGAQSLTLADSSSPSLELARKNLERNDVDPGKLEIAQEDVFGLLRLYRHEGRRFDMVVLDPPKFATNRHQLDKAKRAYKDVNMISMELLNPGGILVTFSCSGAVSAEDFTMAVSWAGVDAGRDVQVLERLSQPPDHPVLAAFPESEYLKGLICRVC